MPSTKHRKQKHKNTIEIASNETHLAQDLSVFM